jgi:hypothetical protein
LSTRYAISAPFGINVYYTLSADGDSFYVSVNINAAQSVVASSAGKLKLRVAMVEDMEFATPPGNNGEKIFHHVMRKMYPGSGTTNNSSGLTLADNWTLAQSQTVDISGTIPSYVYDLSKLRFVAFIQDDGTKDVKQAAISQEQHLTNDAQALGVTSKFYSCGTTYTPTFTLGNNGATTMATANLDIYVDNAFSSTYNWSGSLATGATTNVTLPDLTLASGLHNVKVIVSLPNGQLDINTGKDTSVYSFNIGSATAAVTPLVEGFESGAPAGWAVENADLGATWALANYGSSSAKSYKMDFYSSTDGNIDYLYTTPVDLGNYDHATVKFDRAYALYPFSSTVNSDDRLDIEVSTDCGANWQSIYSKSGDNLASGTSTTSSYSPASGDWVEDSATVNFPNGGNSNTLFRFAGISNYGNNLYLDNINIYKYGNVVTTGVSNIAVNKIAVYPNPANNVLNARITSDKAADATYVVVNALGQKVAGGNSQINAGENLINIDTRNLIDGVYFLSITVDGARTVKRFNVSR